MRSFIKILSVIIIISSCNSPNKEKAITSEKEKPEFSLMKIWSTDSILNTCESVLYDSFRKRIYVSCIDGKPAEEDGKGYIALISPQGEIIKKEWIAGLDAPKGMGISGNTLYVTDINDLVLINIESEEIIKRIAIDGSSFLNDVSVDQNGTVYFTDSDKAVIYRFTDNQVEVWISDSLNRPNGLYAEENRVLVISTGSQDLKAIDKTSMEITNIVSDLGYGDGIEYFGEEGFYLSSSWAGEIFMIYPDSTRISLLKTSDQKINSADIGFNMESKILYVPTFFSNRVDAYQLIEN